MHKHFTGGLGLWLPKRTHAENLWCRSSRLRAGTPTRIPLPSSAASPMAGSSSAAATPSAKKKRADYLLRYTRDFPIAVTEAKAEYKKAADGLQQVKEYAEILDLKFAYATNGREIIEFDFLTGIERVVETFPTPAELWARLMAAQKLATVTVERLLTPFNLSNGKIPHYYQRIAIDRAVRAILTGKKRVLLTMATGTGKTVVAFQICWKLWSSKWNGKGDPTRKPRIL